MPERPQLSEAQFQQQILDLAVYLGLRVFHDYDSRRNTAGFPDLVIVGAGGVLFRELKTDTGRVDPEQRKWLADLDGAGADAGIWRPRDFARARRELRRLARPHLADLIDRSKA